MPIANTFSKWSWRHPHYFSNTNMAAWLHPRNKSPKELLCLTNLGRDKLGNNREISALSINRQWNIWINFSPKLGILANNAGKRGMRLQSSHANAIISMYWIYLQSWVCTYTLTFSHDYEFVGNVNIRVCSQSPMIWYWNRNNFHSIKRV